MSIVPKNADIFGLWGLVKACIIAVHLLFFVNKKWIRQINDP